jgi:hypothetical protein
MTTAERREKARLRSERWRRAHGIMPRRPAQRPWLAEGCSRSTFLSRGKATLGCIKVYPSDIILRPLQQSKEPCCHLEVFRTSAASVIRALRACRGSGILHAF